MRASTSAEFAMPPVLRLREPADFEPILLSGGFLKQMWAPTLLHIADVLGVEIEDWNVVFETDSLDVDIETGFGTVGAGLRRSCTSSSRRSRAGSPSQSSNTPIASRVVWQRSSRARTARGPLVPHRGRGGIRATRSSSTSEPGATRSPRCRRSTRSRRCARPNPGSRVRSTSPATAPATCGGAEASVSSGHERTRRTYRVVQWSTGSVGASALRAIIEHPDLELVGVVVSDPAKEGRDAGELCGVGSHRRRRDTRRRRRARARARLRVPLPAQHQGDHRRDGGDPRTRHQRGVVGVVARAVPRRTPRVTAQHAATRAGMRARREQPLHLGHRPRLCNGRIARHAHEHLRTASTASA